MFYYNDDEELQEFPVLTAGVTADLVCPWIRSGEQKTLSGFCPTSTDMVRVATLTCVYRVQYPIELKSA